MTLFLTFGFVVFTQLALGAPSFAACAYLVRALAGRRRIGRQQLLGWLEASRALRRWAPWAVAAAAATGFLLWRATPRFPPVLGIWVHDWSFVAAGVLPTSCCQLALYAGLRERAGRLRSARRLIRLAGLLLFAGVFLAHVLVWRDLLFEPAFRRVVLRGSPLATWSLLLGLVGLGCGGFIGALAGLTGKPRPSSYFAVLFYLCGLLGVIVAGSQWAPRCA